MSGMARPHCIAVAAALAVLALGVPWPASAQERVPVYIGAQVCATCHEGVGMGHQYSLWQISKHAGAFSSLALPEARRIADMAGIAQDPEKAPVCLGCHATAAEHEDWERDATFALEDGVQCERCHGPGSEYADSAIMRDPKAAAAAGLRTPTRDECAKCHYVKGSHVSVHHRPPLDLDKAWQAIAHPTPDHPEPDRSLPTLRTVKSAGPGLVGFAACGRCHRGEAMGWQVSRWREGPHARAFATLSTPRAFALAKQAGLAKEPQQEPACLKCHTTHAGAAEVAAQASYSPTEGVGCEACHGPGSKYMAEAVMRDPRAAAARGLQRVTRATCDRCHKAAHDKPFDYASALRAIAHPTHPPRPPEPPRYKTPRHLAESPDGRWLFVTCESAGTVAVVDARARRKVGEIRVGGQPTDATFSPDGRRAYVSNRLDDTISVIDVASRRVVATAPVGDEPHGLLTDREGKRLYVLNTSSDDISVLDTGSLREVKRLAASRRPWSLALSPDGRQLIVTNALARFGALRTPPVSEVTIIDTDRAVVAHRAAVPEANLLLGAAWHPSGELALFTLNRTKNLVPMTRILQGWTITNGIGILWRDGTVDQVLLDEPNDHFADATDVAFSPDGRLAFVTSAGTDRLAVVDVAKLTALVKAAPPGERAALLPNRLAASVEFVVGHVSTQANPRGVLVARDGKRAYVVNSLDDSLTVVDLAKLRFSEDAPMAPGPLNRRLDGPWWPGGHEGSVGRIDLGGPRTVSHVRWGEKLFNNASITFQRQFACATCHPDGHVDGLTYDIEADGIGINPVDNRTLRGIYDTDPFKWEGTNPSLARQCGARLAVFFTRIQPFNPAELSAVNDYTVTIPRPPNRNRPLGAELTEAQRRGKTLFERTRTNDRRPIPVGNRCVTCHFPPLFTDRGRHDVGTQMHLDRQGRFDTPHLNNIYDSAPYLHNGISPTLEEIWTRYNPADTHGVTNDMTKDQLNDLIEYLRTL